VYLAGEDDKHYHLAHPSGHAVSMAKAALSPEVHAQIRALPKLPVPKAPRIAKPRAPVKLAEGTPPAFVSGDFTPQPGQEVPENSDTGLGSVIDPAGNLEAAANAIGKNVIEPVANYLSPGAAVDEAMAAQGYGQPSPAPAPEAPTPTKAPTPSAPPATTPPPPVATGEDSGPFAAAAKTMSEAIRSKAENEYTASTTLANLYDTNAKKLLDYDRETQQVIAEDRARQDGVFQQVANAKIDPNHFWEDKGTSGKLLGGLGMILSGIGSGLTGGPNLAHQVINNAIERDIDAQRANLSKNQNLLSYYQRQTNDDLSARQLTKATMLQAYAGQIAAQTSRASAGVAKQNGVIAQQQAQTEAYSLSQQAIARSQGIKQNEIALRQAQEAEKVRHELYGDNGQARPASAQVLQHAVAVGLVPANQVVTIDRQGTQARAKGDDSAKALNEKLPEIHSAQDLVDRLQQLHDNPTAVLAPGTDIGDEYNKTRRELAVKTEKALAGRVSDETVEQQIGAIGGNWNQYVHSRDPLAAIRNTLEGERQNLLNQHVWGYRQPGQVQERAPSTGAANPPQQGAIHITNGSQSGWLLPGKALPAGWKQG
jgi:hypothetical protein